MDIERIINFFETKFSKKVVERPFNWERVNEITDSDYTKGFFLTNIGKKVHGLNLSLTSKTLPLIVGVIKDANDLEHVENTWFANGDSCDKDDDKKLRMFILE